MGAMDPIHKIVDNVTPTPNVVSWSPVDSRRPTDDIKYIPKRPVFIVRRRAKGSKTHRIWDGTEEDQFTVSGVISHSNAKDDIDQIRAWVAVAAKGTYVLTYYDDEYSTGITVEIIQFDYIKRKGHDRRWYQFTMTLEKQ